jgi:hypothetical protein
MVSHVSHSAKVSEEICGCVAELLRKGDTPSVKVPLSGLTLNVRATFNRTSPKKDKIKILLKNFLQK